MRSFIVGVRHVERLGADDPGDDRVRRDPVPAALHARASSSARAARPWSSSSDAWPKPPSVPATDAMLTIRPHSRSFMCGQTACAQLNAPVRLTRRSRSHSSGCWSPNWPTWSSVPALLTRMSTEPSSSTACATAAATCSRSVTSQLDGERAPAHRPDLLRRRLGVRRGPACARPARAGRSASVSSVELATRPAGRRSRRRRRRVRASARRPGRGRASRR